jgi:hypothetical protein
MMCNLHIQTKNPTSVRVTLVSTSISVLRWIGVAQFTQTHWIKVNTSITKQPLLLSVTLIANVLTVAPQDLP